MPDVKPAKLLMPRDDRDALYAEWGNYAQGGRRRYEVFLEDRLHETRMVLSRWLTAWRNGNANSADVLANATVNLLPDWLRQTLANPIGAQRCDGVWPWGDVRDVNCRCIKEDGHDGPCTNKDGQLSWWQRGAASGLLVDGKTQVPKPLVTKSNGTPRK